MSRKHPQNGPSLSKAPYKKQKPLTDEELARIQACEKDRQNRLIEKAEDGKRFSKAVKAFGGIPVRGTGAEAFRQMVAKPKNKTTQTDLLEAAKQAEADETFRKVAKPPKGGRSSS
jgi:hypothetical protein